MDTAAYNRMVLEHLRTNSPEVFGNLTPENARFIVPTFIEAANESVVIFSGSMPPWFYNEADTIVGAPILDIIQKTAKRFYEKFAENAAGAIRIITVNGVTDPNLDTFVDDVKRQNGGVEVVKIIQATYRGNPQDLQHYIVIDHRRYRLEAPHNQCRDLKPDTVMAEVCCNGPVKAKRLEAVFDTIWAALNAKRSA